ncbi:hypothetical protein BGZ49_002819 [Haplosporangium sp. Z 27]|nr:hypothetical protein BGZ49_002819 [Haplosporangium sp. Z 27]
MSDSSTFITQDTAQLSLDATVVASSNSTTHALSQEEEDRNNNDSHSYPEENQEEERSSEQLDSEPKPEQTLRQRGPQLDHTKPQQKHNNPQASDGYGSLRDVWADQGDFPLVLDKVSHRSISVRGGSRVLLTGANFREGVEVAFECPRLGDSVQSRVIIPRVLKSTEIEFITPNLLDWWAIADKDYSCKQLDLSVTLTCGGVKGQEDVNTSFEMFAVDDSEIELLHMIVELHRQHILMTIKKHGSLETEAERASRQRSLSLLQLSPPQSVSKTEHFALSVIYMHCDTRDEISTEGMNVIKSIVQDGHGMLHLAVLQGQLTLVRELSRHLLAWFQSHPITVNSELFLKNRNGETALDFARSLGNSEIEKVLVETLESAEEFKKSILKTLPQRPPTPPLPTPNHSWPVPGINESPRLYSSSTPSPTMNRPLPPTPLTFPSHEHGFNIRASSYHSISSSSSSIVESPMQYSYPPVHSIQATAINGGYGPESSQAIYENSQSHNNASPGQHHMYPNQHNIPPPHPDPTSAYGVPPSTPLRGNSWSSQHSMQGEQPSPSLPQPTVAPPLPPRHKVTRVTRPKQFIIPQLESLLTQGRLLPQEPFTNALSSTPSAIAIAIVHANARISSSSSSDAYATTATISAPESTSTSASASATTSGFHDHACIPTSITYACIPTSITYAHESTPKSDPNACATANYAIIFLSPNAITPGTVSSICIE